MVVVDRSAGIKPLLDQAKNKLKMKKKPKSAWVGGEHLSDLDSIPGNLRLNINCERATDNHDCNYFIHARLVQAFYLR